MDALLRSATTNFQFSIFNIQCIEGGFKAGPAAA